jgi:penicillin amidase
MRTLHSSLHAALVAALLAGCPSDPPADDDDATEAPTPSPLDAVPVTAEFDLPCLSAPVQVLRTENDHPHIYAENDDDLACAMAFVTARDRFFSMELARRLGWASLSEILGELALDADIEQAAIGSRKVAQNILDAADADMLAYWEAYAGGVNAYIAGVRDGRFPIPGEFEAAAPFLAYDSAVDMLTDWDATAMAGMAATLKFQLSWETNELGIQRGLQALDTWGAGMPEEDLRKDGARFDIFEHIRPIYPVASDAGEAGTTAGWDASWYQANPGEGARSEGRAPTMRLGAKVEAGTLDRAIARGEQTQKRWGHDGDMDWGSNAWAIGPTHTASGNAIVAGDGHLPLTVPPLLHNMHLDTELLGGGDWHMIGVTIPGTPALGLGTNGQVAWSHTWLGIDVNDWYAEEIVLGKDGLPASTRFQGGEAPLVAVADTFVVDALTDPETVQIVRYETADGRLLYSMEGDTSGVDQGTPGAVNVGGTWLIAQDMDGDGVISAISSVYNGFFEEDMLEHVIGWNQAADVDEWAAHHANVSYGQSFAVADTQGNVMYSSYQPVACRNYLPRDTDGVPLPGANPQLLIDGTQYPSYVVRYDADRNLDPAKDDPTACILTYEEYPNIKNPSQGYVVTANNAPHGAAFDNNLWNDPVYIGGPWYANYRANRISQLIEEQSGSIDVPAVSAQQGDHRSNLAARYLGDLLAALDAAEAYAADGEVGDSSAARMAADYATAQVAWDEAKQRLIDWQIAGMVAHSGVETFYNSPTDDEVLDSIATVIWNTTIGRVQDKVLGDEQFPGIYRPGGTQGRARTFDLVMRGRGEGNPMGLASWNPATNESIFFDVASTPEIETSDEVFVEAFVEALEFLTTPRESDRSGGYNTADQTRWLWGMKHYVHFDSILLEFLGSGGPFAAVFGQFAITPDVLPLDDPTPTPGHPLYGFPGFPRPGDAFAVDAAGGVSASRYSYGSGPVMRLVVEMDPAGIHGVSVLPGGQSGDTDSEFFADQAALWLGNETFPLRFYVDDVVAGATGHEVFSPGG